MSELFIIIFKAVKSILKNYYTYVILLLIVASYFTISPFIKNAMQAPDNRIYLGAENDYNTYFKYLKTTLVGQNLSLSNFKQKFNSSPTDEKFYLLSGKITSVFSMSHFASYHFSRLKFNSLFFVFLYLIISTIFKSRSTKLALFSLISLTIIPLSNLLIVNSPLSIFNFYAYPHVAFFRLIIIIFIFILLKILKLPKKLNFSIFSPISLIPLISLIFLIGLYINQRQVSLLKINLKSDPQTTNLIYLSKDFYAGIGYLRDNALPDEKIVCFKKCAIVSDLFADIQSVIGPFNNINLEKEAEIKAELPGIFDNPKFLKSLISEGAVYFFIGPEEKLYLTPDFYRLQIKEVIKNKEITVYKIQPLP